MAFLYIWLASNPLSRVAPKSTASARPVLHVGRPGVPLGHLRRTRHRRCHSAFLRCGTGLPVFMGIPAAPESEAQDGPRATAGITTCLARHPRSMKEASESRGRLPLKRHPLGALDLMGVSSWPRSARGSDAKRVLVRVFCALYPAHTRIPLIERCLHHRPQNAVVGCRAATIIAAATTLDWCPACGSSSHWHSPGA
jgi:hypothetical protein